ncbi:NAD(P)-dependent alcohol dehydrogenase [Actinoplanes sp. NPDC049265]|uniref:NAD(P)-dependent alcohol dehydrogenase n=1 Tax=Actinoplanes sp. NPDC049265 TaxID=3363902 RepID=UPI00371BAC28
MRTTTGMALTTPGGSWEPYRFERRDLRPDDIAVRVTWCGVCHTDLHAAEDLAAGAAPLVPGHEFVGEVAAVGGEVTAFRVGDPVAVGNIVDSCGVCAACRSGNEQFCAEFPTTTYGGRDRVDGSVTLGAYSGEYVVRESFVYPVPSGLDPAGVAPLMCAGATVYEPLRRWAVGAGQQVGVVGLGGLGHLAVRFAQALGAGVTVFTSSSGKAEAARALGADEVVVSRDADAMKAQADRYDFILDTASAKHDPSPYLRALRMDGSLCMLGIPDRYEPEAMALMFGYKRLVASGGAGRPRMREMLEFAARHEITADVERVPARDVGRAMDRLSRNDVRWRFVLDLADLG